MDHENVIDCLVPACQLNVLFFFSFLSFLCGSNKSSQNTEHIHFTLEQKFHIVWFNSESAFTVLFSHHS